MVLTVVIIAITLTALRELAFVSACPAMWPVIARLRGAGVCWELRLDGGLSPVSAVALRAPVRSVGSTGLLA